MRQYDCYKELMLFCHALDKAVQDSRCGAILIMGYIADFGKLHKALVDVSACKAALRSSRITV
jgi:hypothetical protein